MRYIYGGKTYYIAIPPPPPPPLFAKGRKMESTIQPFSAYPGKGWGVAMGGKWLYNTGNLCNIGAHSVIG